MDIKMLLRQFSLSTSGNKDVMYARIFAHVMEGRETLKKKRDDERVETVKRAKMAIEDIADEFICPITHELPINPVMAQDGRCLFAKRQQKAHFVIELCNIWQDLRTYCHTAVA